MEEIWKDVVGYEGLYSVSNLGRIRRESSGKGAKRYRIFGIKRYGKYTQVQLYKNKIRSTPYVHRLVLESFVGKMPEGNQGNHIDGNKDNNCLSNLEYVTPSENIKHSFRIGLNVHTYGSKHPMTILKDIDVLSIREHFSNGIKQNKIAKIFNVTPSTINAIIHRKVWKHI